MTLSTCSACGGQVSDAAEACPHCGHPTRTAAQTHGETREQVAAATETGIDLPMAGTVLGGILIIFGSFIEWAVVSAGPISIDVIGTDGLGYVTAAAGTAIVLGGLMRARVFGLIGSILAGTIAAYEIVQITFLQTAGAELGLPLGATLDVDLVSLTFGVAEVSVGIGLFLVAIGAVVSFASTISSKR